MVRGFSLVVVGSLLAFHPASAQKVDLDELAILARAAPPEIAADALLRIVSMRELVTDRTPAAAKKRLALLEEAWGLADSAQESVRRQRVPGLESDARELVAAMSLPTFDRLSLKSRVVMALARVQPQDARQRFLTLRVDPPMLPCGEGVMYDVNAYYSAAEGVFRNGFTSAERARGDHLVFIENLLYGLRSTSQLSPLVGLLESVNPAAELERVTGVLASMLSGMTTGDFAAALSPVTAADFSLERLTGRMKTLGIRPDALIGAYRSYLVRHLSGPRCEVPNMARSDRSVVQRFNTRLRLAATTEIPPILLEEMKPASIDPLTPAPLSALSSRVRQLTQEIQRVRAARKVTIVSGTKEGGPRRTLYVKVDGREYASLDDAPVDEAHFRKIVELKDQLALWRMTADDDPEEYFQLKSRLYTTLFSTHPTGPVADEVLAGAVELFTHYDLLRHNRTKWYASVTALLSAASPAGGPEVLERVRQRMTESGHPPLKAVVALTAAFERPRW